MAKIEDASRNIVANFQEFIENKNLGPVVLRTVLEESFRKAICAKYGSDENFHVLINPERGDCEISQTLTVVPDGEVTNPNTEIALSEALKIDPETEIDETIELEIDLLKFGRRAILNLRQTVAS